MFNQVINDWNSLPSNVVIPVPSLPSRICWTNFQVCFVTRIHRLYLFPEILMPYNAAVGAGDNLHDAIDMLRSHELACSLEKHCIPI